MPSAKQKDAQDTRRAKHDAGKTLDHFFSKNPDSTPNKLLRGPGNYQSKGNTAFKPGTNKGPARRDSEIIIIESDDEPEVPVTLVGCKKRRYSEDSDIEIVEASSFSAKRASAARFSVERQTVSNSNGVVRGDTTSTYTFGRPSLLSNNVLNSRQTVSLDFGGAGSLLSSTAQDGATTSNFTLARHSFTVGEGTLAESNSKCDTLREETIQVDVDLSEDAPEEWLMGDDEMGNTYRKEEDDDEIEFVEDTLLEVGSCEPTIDCCPCCKRKLQGLRPSVRLHSNMICFSQFTN